MRGKEVMLSCPREENIWKKLVDEDQGY